MAHISGRPSIHCDVSYPPIQNATVIITVFYPSHPDRDRLFSGSNDEMIKVWNLTQPDYQHNVRMSRPYDQLKIKNIRGVSDAQWATLLALGAREK